MTRLIDSTFARNAVLLAVVLPHGHKVLRANDERFQVVVVLKDTGDGGRHEGLAQTDHVADEHAVAFVQMMGRDLDRGDLEIE